MYAYPVWRRAPFVGLLIIVLVLTYAPATTQGTATVRLAALSAPSVVTHIYVSISSIEFHRAGLPFDTSYWTTVSQAFPVVDILSSAGPSIPQTMTSTLIHSGRYDSVRILFTNSTLWIKGVPVPRSLTAPPSLEVKATLTVSPNGIGDLLIVVAFDYVTLFASSPSLSFIVISDSST